MNLRRLFACSHLAVVSVFVAVLCCVFTWAVLTRINARPGNQDTALRFSAFFQQNPTPQEAQEFLDELGFPNHVTLDTFTAEGKQVHYKGPERTLEPPVFAGQLLNGQQLVAFDYETEEAIQWIPIQLEGEPAYIRVGNRKLPGELIWMVLEQYLYSALIAMVIVCFLAIPVSRFLANPMRKLARVAEQFGRQGFEIRAEVEGPTELRELSSSFNSMADYIERNTRELKCQKEKAERTEASRRQFLADVSHNLRTPLAAILGWTDALIDGVATDEDVYRQRIRREVVHVSRIMQRLLELSRWEHAGPMLRLESIDMGDLLMEVAENLEEAAEQSEVELQFEGLQPGLAIYADRQKARDMIQILLENVVEHAGVSTHAVVSLAKLENRLQLTVKDDGVGFPEALLSDVQLERGVNDAGKVSLGLAIASRLAHAHGGKLIFENGASGGALVRVDFGLAGSSPQQQSLAATA